MPHKKPIALETDARKMKSFARLGGLKEAPASIGGEYFTEYHSERSEPKKFFVHFFSKKWTGFLRAVALKQGNVINLRKKPV